jgi:phage tail-like protein
MAEPVISYLLNIHGPEGYSARFEIPIGITIIGRQAGAGLLLESKYISRSHARLECIGTECHITDLGSDNGTYLNDEKLPKDTPTLLNHQDHIKIGPFSLEVEKIETSFEVEIPITSDQIVALEGLPKAIEAPSTPAEPPPPPTGEDLIPVPPPEDELIPPGLTIKSERFLNFLPGIYHTDFMSRFLGIFEAILTPIEWNIDNYDLFLSPRTCPNAFLPWLANWFEVVFDDTWSEAKRRIFLQEAYQIYALRGTKKALRRTLEIYTGYTPEIDDLASDLEPHTFRVIMPVREKEIRRANVEALINAHKPAHTAYELHFQE